MSGEGEDAQGELEAPQERSQEADETPAASSPAAEERPSLVKAVAEAIADLDTWLCVAGRLLIVAALPALLIARQPGGAAVAAIWVGSLGLVVTGLAVFERAQLRRNPGAELGWLARRMTFCAFALVFAANVQQVYLEAFLRSGNPAEGFAALGDFLRLDQAAFNRVLGAALSALLLSVPLGTSSAMVGWRGAWEHARRQLGPLFLTYIGVSGLAVLGVVAAFAGLSAGAQAGLSGWICSATSCVFVTGLLTLAWMTGDALARWVRPREEDLRTRQLRRRRDRRGSRRRPPRRP